MSTETKVSVVLCSLQTLSMSEHLKKTLLGGFSCVNTRLAFDTNILLNDTNKEKVLIGLDINGKKRAKRISSKILKMDENNQYGMAMTKPLPYGCIKKTR